MSKEGYVTCGKTNKQTNKQNRSVAFEMLELAMTWKIVSVRKFPRVTCQLQMFAKVAEGLFTPINRLDRHSTTSTTSALTRICRKLSMELNDNQEKKEWEIQKLLVLIFL